MKYHRIQFLALNLVILLPFISSKKSKEKYSYKDKYDPADGKIGSCPDLSLFNSCFLNEVRKSSTLREMFSMKEVSPQNEAIGLFYMSMAEAANLGDTKAAYHAHMGTKFITECTKDLAPILISAYSNSLAKFLKSQGVLSQYECHLAQECAYAIERMGERVMEKCIPLSKIGAIDMGVQDFLYSHEILTSKDRGRFHFLFGLEFLEPYNFTDYDKLIFAEQSRNSNSKEGDLSVSSEHCGIDFDFDEDLCGTPAPAVTKFLSAIVAMTTYSSHEYINTFDLDDIPPEELAQAIFHLSQYHLAQRYNNNSTALADHLYTVVLDFQDKNNNFEWEITAIAGTAKFLYSRKYLTDNNAEDLAKKYLELVKENDANYGTDSVPQSRLVSLFKSLIDFLLHLRLFSVKDGEEIFFHLGNEIRCLMRVNSGKGK